EQIVIGEGSNIQDGAVLHADLGFPCVIENDVTVGHLAMVHGCRIGEGTMVGIGSIILNGATIGKGCIIGANALIPEGKVIPDHSLVLGVPGKVVRSVTEADRDMVALGARHYRSNAAFFRENLKEA
ncbi:MAG: gamma carbonic anhydrase family protein, partial [Myxococcota bacterium]